MSQIFTNFPFLPTWYYFNTFLYHVAFWDDLREFKVENFNFKQASLFFFWKTEWPIFKCVFRAKYSLFCGSWRRKELFYEKKGWIFRKSGPIFSTKKRFQDIGTPTYPIFWRFFKVSRAIGPPGVNQFFENFCQRCILLVFILVPSFILISWTEAY